jgi:hypothetical protein
MSLMTSHIYYPYGVATMVMLALGHSLLVVAATRRPATRRHRRTSSPATADQAAATP